MKKQVTQLTFALAMFSAFAVMSQQNQIQPCNTYAAMEQHFAADPQARINFEATQKRLIEESEKITNGSAKPAQAFEYTVPVVFHVLYDCGISSVSDADCISALNQVNKDFAKLSSDTSLIFQPFKQLYINSDIKFMLAKKDPQGNCINGIVRHHDAKTTWSQSAASQSFYWPYTWDPTKYLNIYIVNSIVPQGTVTGGGIIVGYTYLPGTWPTGNAHDAIVYRGSFLTGGTTPASRSLTHEIGHWLGLPHTFGNSNNPGVVCGDDGITDTPVTKGNFGGCPVSTTNTNILCATTTINYYRNVENIMNYSDCPRNFTTGQTNVMRNVLAGTVSNRQNLWQAGTLFSTDVNGGAACGPVTDFFSNNCSYTVCAGGSITFKDMSWNGASPTYQWAADNSAVVTAPTASTTSIMFPLMGTSDVTLTVTNGQGSDTKVRTVTVMDPTPGITTTHFESFESGLPANWQITDIENDMQTWQNTNAAAYDQTYSYYIDGGQMPPSTSDHLIMPIIDVKNNPGAKLEFAYAYRQEMSGHNDVLKIQGSKDCGGTWADIVSLAANSMQNGSGGIDGNPFFPYPWEWKIYTISSHPNWNQYTNSSSVMIRFNFIEGANGYGNNIFVDAINFVTQPVGVNELTRSMGFSLYPNPTSGEAFVSLNLNDAAHVKITVLDLVGKEVKTVTNTQFSAGEQSIQVNNDNSLIPGVYFVNVAVNGATMVGKLVIE